VESDGTYNVYGIARDKYRLWIIRDLNSNGTYDSTDSEPYVQVPKRGTQAFKEDTFIDMSAAGVRVDAELGVLAGAVTNTTSWDYPQVGLYQGWDVTGYNDMDSTGYQFIAIKTHNIDSGGNTPQDYYLLRFDDDNSHDGVYTYADENDEVFQGVLYSADQSGLSLNTD
jgi:hypothetical protein